MDFSYKHLLPADFHPDSRVWIYQGSRLFTMSEALEIEEMLHDFVAGWLSHGAKVKGYANLFFGQFLVLMADESQSGVSGCSTDSSVRLVKAIQERTGVDLFNRQNLAFIINNKVQLLPLSQLNYAISNNFVTPKTIYFNNTVLTRHDLENDWMIPVEKSWLSKRIEPQKV